MAPAQPPSRIPRNVLVVAFVALASGFGQDLITPILPSYLALVGVSAAGIGLLDGVLQGATNVFRFVSGVLSDRVKKRKGLVFLGYALSSVARPMLALVGSFTSIAVMRLVDGIGKGMKDAPRDALVADSAQANAQGRAFGFHRLVDTAGSVLGPLLAGLLLLAFTPSLASYRLIFLLSAIPGAAALLLIWFGIREKATNEKPRVAPRAQRLPGAFWLFTIIVTIAMLTKINDSLFLLRGADIGIPNAWIPIVFAGFTLVYAIIAYPVGILSDRIGKLPCLAAGWLVLSGVEFGFSRNPSLPFAITLFAFYGLFFALTEGSGRAYIAGVVPSASRGTAYALYYTLTGVAVIIGGYALGNVWQQVSPELAFRLAAVGSLLAGIGFAGMSLLWKTSLVKSEPIP